jgi:hypothetical protein
MEEAASATGEKLEAAAGEMASALEKASEEVRDNPGTSVLVIVGSPIW